ncbi:MAG: hypothetical protein DRG30_10830 [Epsilonproteobacteria bacterium]|nr:MAG: hypothetical protein DRG30_10830 [Campylobacterota bacterium]
MITSKQFTAEGNDERYLSDFIIASDQHARVYCYRYDPLINEPVLEDGTTIPSRWSYPDNLWIRPTPLPIPSEDLVGLNHYDVIDNGIKFYVPVDIGVKVWVEVATTPEEFGLTMMLPFQEYLEQLIKSGCAFSNNAESWADEDKDNPVQTYINCTEHFEHVPLAFSAKHYSKYAEEAKALAERWAVEIDCVEPDPNYNVGLYSSKHYSNLSSKWAQNASDDPITDCDGNIIGYSAFTYAQLAYFIVSGTEFIGVWDVTTDAYPTEGNDGDPLALGMWWLVDSQTDEGHDFDGKTWYTGDKIYYIDDGSTPPYFARVPNFVHWDRIVGKPTTFPPADHIHNYATDTVRGDLRVLLTGTTLDIWNID